MSTTPKVDGYFYALCFEGEKNVILKKFTSVKDGGAGTGNVKQGQFYDRYIACKKEIFPTFDWLQPTVLKIHAYAGCCGV